MPSKVSHRVRNSAVLLSSGNMAPKKPVDKLADNLKGLVIGASGTIPGYQHGMFLLKSKQSRIKRERFFLDII
jgi:hypothetical protein